MKKRTSRLLSVLLTLVMVLGLLPALGTTALADERYDLYLEVGENAFDKPEIQSIIYKLTDQHTKRLGRYTVPRPDWSDDLIYYVAASSSDEDIISNEGLAKRPGECLLTIGKSDTYGQSTNFLKMKSVLICVTNARIDRVAVTGIDAPVTGQPLDRTAECSTPGIASATVEWYNSTDGVDVASGAVAQGGKAYSAFVTVTPASGYELVGYSTTKVTVNGGTASPVYGGTDYLTVAYHFPATGGENSENQNWVTTKKIISEVAVTGVVTPVDGAKPVETCELGGTGYTLKSMSWYDGSLKMNSVGTFQAGKTYRVCFYLLPERGYTFNSVDSMTATVNGKTVEVTNVYGEPEQRGVTIDFTCEKPSKTISTVDITELDALKPGTAADYTASTSTPGCTVKKVEYQMFQKIMTNYVPADGENIAVVVTVAAADGYEFAGGSTATWNGLKSDDTAPWFSERRQSTVEDIKAQLEYREANQEKVAAFHATRTLGESTKVILDEDAGTFLVTSARNWQSANPDVLAFSDVTGCTLDIDEDKTEIQYKDKEGDRQSFSPKRYAYSYDFYIVIHVNNPYFNEIRFKLNSSKVDNDEETLLDSPTAMPRSRSGASRPMPGAVRPGAVRPGAVRPGAVPPGGRPMPGRAPMGGGMMGGVRVSNADEVRASLEYQQYEQMGQEIREALLQIRQEARDSAVAANAPKTAVTCSYCGATTTPDASGCCEFCGGAIGG